MSRFPPHSLASSAMSCRRLDGSLGHASTTIAKSASSTHGIDETAPDFAALESAGFAKLLAGKAVTEIESNPSPSAVQIIQIKWLLPLAR